MLEKFKSIFKRDARKDFEDSKMELSERATERLSRHAIIDTIPHLGGGIAVIFDNYYFLAIGSEDKEEQENATYDLFFASKEMSEQPHIAKVDGVLVIGEPKDGLFVVVALFDEDSKLIGGISYKPNNDSAPAIPKTTSIHLGRISDEDIPRA